MTLRYWLPEVVVVEMLDTESFSDTPTVCMDKFSEPECMEMVVDPPFPCTKSPDTLPEFVEISVIKVL